MKVVFLDIDGVINTMAEVGFRECFGEGVLKAHEEAMEVHFDKQASRKNGSPYPFDPTSLYHLHRILEVTGAKIVVSSTWRTDLETMKSWFAKGTLVRDSIIDRTPYSKEVPTEVKDRYRTVDGRFERGDEIHYWLSLHPEVTKWAVLDDDSDMNMVMEGFFKTNSYDGLDFKTRREVIRHLMKKDYIRDHYRLNYAINEFASEVFNCLDAVSTEDKEQVIQNIVTNLQNLEGWNR